MSRKGKAQEDSPPRYMDRLSFSFFPNHASACIAASTNHLFISLRSSSS